MKINKKFFCLVVIFLIILTANAVSANEDISDVNSSDNSIESGILSVNLDESDSSQSSGSSNAGNLAASGQTYIITNSTFNDYFKNGELMSNVSAGSILDFQGTFTGTAYKVNITKPVSIISSTGDALFNDIGKKDSNGGCFHISSGGSGTTVNGINFLNSAFYVTHATNVSIENINMMCDVSGVGQSTGFMCIQADSKYVTVKNSYFENRGTGSSIIVIGYSDYCVIDNNEVVVNGTSGNAIYITTYVPSVYVGHDPIGNQISNNYIHGLSSPYCMALVVAGKENIIENNTIDYTGASGIAGQSFSTQFNNSYINNVLTGGCSFSAGDSSYISHNTVDGTMIAGSNSIIENNEVKSLSLSKPNSIISNNIIGNANLETNAINSTFTDNVISSTVNVKSKNNTFKYNVINTSSEYAIDLFTTTGNEVAYNNLNSSNFTGDAAVKNNGDNFVHDNAGLDVVTENNFFYFFTNEGVYNSNLTQLYFKGDFDNIVDAITINNPLTIIGLDTTLNNMVFILNGDNITLNNIEMEISGVNSSAILINASNTTIKSMTINYTGENNCIEVISGNATIENNNIETTSQYTVDAIDSSVIVKDNVLIANELTSDASVNYNYENSAVYNNTPEMEKIFLFTNDLTKYYGNVNKLEALILDSLGKPLANRSVGFIINGVNYTRTSNENGIASISINLNVGSYNATVFYNVDYKNVTINILSTIDGKNLTKMYMNSSQYKATFLDTEGNLLTNTNVTFNINGVFYTRSTNDLGVAALNIRLNPGEYILTAINPNSTEMYSNTVTVLASIESDDLTKYYKNDSQYVVTAFGYDGKVVGAGEVVTFNINGVFYNRTTNATGQAVLNINLQPGDYIITAEYNKCMVSNDIKVKPVLSAENMTKKYGSPNQFVVNLVDGQGNPYANQEIQFNINGMLNYGITNASGQAGLNVDLQPGEYIVTSSYNTASISNKITILS